MKRVVLLTGSTGFVGKAVMRRAKELGDLTIIPIERKSAVSQVGDVRLDYDDSQISLLNLAWPSLQSCSASTRRSEGDDREWSEFRDYISTLVASCEQSSIRFFHVGSGIEPYAASSPPTVDDPYLSYGRRKIEVWNMISKPLAGRSWRLRLHFLFGQGESSHRFVPAAIKACREKKPVAVGVPSRRRYWLDVDDAATGLLTAMEQGDPDNWDICGDTPVSFTELLDCIAEVIGADVNIDMRATGTADARCPVVKPQNPAPFMSPGIGGKDNLKDRLNEYALMMSEKGS